MTFCHLKDPARDNLLLLSYATNTVIVNERVPCRYSRLLSLSCERRPQAVGFRVTDQGLTTGQALFE